MRTFMILFCLSIGEKVFPGFVTDSSGTSGTILMFLLSIGFITDLRDAFGDRGNGKKG